MFDPQLLSINTDGQDSSESYTDQIDNEFGPLSEVEDTLVQDNAGPPRKKIKLREKSTRKEKSSEHGSADEMPSTSDRKQAKKKSLGQELAYQIEEWRKEQKLARLNPEVEVMDKIKKHYADQIEELSFQEYGRLVALLRKSHPQYGNYTGAEYFRMMGDGDQSKFRDQLMEIWFESIKFPKPEIDSMLPPS